MNSIAKQTLFNHLSDEHDVIALESEMFEIERIVLQGQWHFYPQDLPENGALVVGFWGRAFKFQVCRFEGVEAHFTIDNYSVQTNPTRWMPIHLPLPS
jgi:hypothetical protein